MKNVYLIDIKQSKAVQISNSICDNYYPQKDLYNWNPYKWIYLSETSSIHSSICGMKIDMTVGKGLSYDHEGNREAKAFVEKNFIEDDLLLKLATDKVIFNNFAFLAKWQLGGKKIEETNHVAFKKVRIQKPKANEYLNTATIANFNASNWNSQKISLPLFHRPLPFASKEVRSDLTQLYFKNQYSVGDEVYGLPDYAGADNYILIDIRLADFHLGNISRGFFPSVMVDCDIEQFIPDPNHMGEAQENGDPYSVENPEFVQFMTAIERWYGGSENSGAILFKRKEYTIEKFEASTTVDLFNSLNSIATQKIVSSHRLTSPVLIGQAGAGTLSGNAGEISVAAELFYNTVIIPAYQNPLLKSLKDVLRMNGYSDKLTIIQSKPVQFTLSESILEKILTINELRSIVGYERLEYGDVALKSIA